MKAILVGLFLSSVVAFGADEKKKSAEFKWYLSNQSNDVVQEYSYTNRRGRPSATVQEVKIGSNTLCFIMPGVTMILVDNKICNEVKKVAIPEPN